MTPEEIQTMIQWHRSVIHKLRQEIDLHLNSINALEGLLRHKQQDDEDPVN